MILKYTPRDIKHNLDNPITFKMKESAEAFRILSTQLYSDPIKAIVRELTCNAIDAAHQANKNATEAVKVTLPSPLEKIFVVEDKGVGMDGKEVEELYTTYFGTSKNQSNDYIRALGLGSKSPFSYTDRFTVQTSKDGTSRTYLAFLNSKGFPQISLLDESATEETGTKISIAIKESEDINKFKKAYFDVCMGLGFPLNQNEFISSLVKMYMDVVEDELPSDKPTDFERYGYIIFNILQSFAKGGFFFFPVCSSLSDLSTIEDLHDKIQENIFKISFLYLYSFSLFFLSLK